MRKSVESLKQIPLSNCKQQIYWRTIFERYSEIHEKIVNMPHLRSCIFTENELRRWLFLVQSLWNLQNCLKSIHAFLWGEYFCYMMEMQNIQSKVLSRSCTVLYCVDAAFWLESCLTSRRSLSANRNRNCMWIVL